MKRLLILLMLIAPIQIFSQGVPVPNAVIRYLDANGKPLSGGKLYTYVSGTSTPLNTWTSSAMSSLNANPVVLDTTGTASVWLGPGPYRLRLTNALGVQQFDVQGVPGNQASPFTGSGTTNRIAKFTDTQELGNSAASESAGNFNIPENLVVTGTTRFNSNTYTWPSSQGSSRFLKTNGAGFLSWDIAGISVTNVYQPETYGAICDGSTDDSAAFIAMSAAINLANTTAAIVLPARTCYLGNTINATHAPIDIEVSNVSIRGYGKGISVLTYTSVSAAGAAIWVSHNNGTSAMINFAASDFTLKDLSVASRSGSGSSGISVYVVDDVSVQNIEFINIKGNAAFTNNSNGYANVNTWVENCTFTGTAFGNYIDGDAVNVGGNNIYISHNSVTGVKRLAFEGGGSTNGVHIDGNDVDLINLGAGISNMAGNGIFITNNRIVNTKVGSNAIYMVGEPDSTFISDVVISGNTIVSYGPGNDLGILFGSTVATANVLVSNNKIKSRQPIYLGADITGQWNFVGNIFDLNSASVAFLSGNPVITAEAVLNITGNIVSDGNMAVPWFTVTLDSFTHAKVRNVRLNGNIIGVSFDNQQNGQIDGVTGVGSTPDVNAGLISTSSTATVLGALVGDVVQFVTDTPLPNGVTIQGNVSSDDTVSYWSDNRSAVDFSGVGNVLRIIITRK